MSSVIKFRWFAWLFGGWFTFLVFDPSFFGSKWDSGFLSLYRFGFDCQNHFTKLRQAIGSVASLVTEPVARNHEVTLFGNAIGILLEKSWFDCRGQRLSSVDRPLQNYFWVYFVDVLAAGAGRPSIAKFKFSQADLDFFTYIQLVLELYSYQARMTTGGIMFNFDLTIEAKKFWKIENEN